MSDKYTLIAAEYAANMAAPAADAPALTKMCLWIGVSKSGYYEWKDRPLSATAERQEYLKGKIKEIFDDNDETYGYRRVHAELARQGEQATSELVRRLMRDLGLVPCQVRKPRSLTTQATDIGKIPDLVKRDFTAAAPYRKLISDITEIRTWQGKVYLATVIDCFSKEVIGWAMASHFRTPLITRLSWLCGKVFPGQAEDADFFGCRLVGARCLKSGGDDDAAELGGHVGCGRLGFAGVPGGAGPVFGHVRGVVAGGWRTSRW